MTHPDPAPNPPALETAALAVEQAYVVLQRLRDDANASISQRSGAVTAAVRALTAWSVASRRDPVPPEQDLA